MPPSGLAILIGAGPTTGSGIARILASPSHGNMAVALLSRTADPSLPTTISKSCYGGEGILKAFRSDTSEPSLRSAFDEIKSWSASISPELKLTMAIYNVKHSHKVPFEEENVQRYTESLTTYAGGAMAFSQLALKWMLGQFPSSNTDGSGDLQKKGTIIFTSTLGALRTNPQFAAYGATRASVRMLAQSLAREFSARGVHVVHAIANGGITDKVRGGGWGEIDTANHQGYGEPAQGVEGADEDFKKVREASRMRAESVGKLYLSCALQECDLWVHELDMRPAAEKF